MMIKIDKTVNYCDSWDEYQVIVKLANDCPDKLITLTCGPHEIGLNRYECLDLWPLLKKFAETSKLS
jgi:hypothetical protein